MCVCVCEFAALEEEVAERDEDEKNDEDVAAGGRPGV